MKILAFDGSAVAASAAVLDGGRLLASAYQNNGLTHSRTLLPMAESMLKNGGLALSDMGLLAVSVGPGSFTGLRIAVSLVKGIAFALDLPCCGVSTLEAMAFQLPREAAVACAVMDARAGQVYNALFELGGERPERLCEDRAISLDALREELVSRNKPYIFVGDGAALCYNRFGQECAARIAPENLRYQSAYGVAAAAAAAGGGAVLDAERLVPRYLRLPQAERERLAKKNAGR